MWKTHIPQNHPEFPEEKSDKLSSRDKLILHAVRDAVNSVHDFSQMRNLKTLEVFQKVKKTVSKNLAQSFDEKVEKAITKWLILQIQQYEKISKERFEHRMNNGKIKRDFLFLMKAAQFLNHYTVDATFWIAELYLWDGKYPTLDNSRALRSMRIFIQALGRYMKKKEIKKFIRECRGEYQN